MKTAIFIFSALLLANFAQADDSIFWKIKKDSWSETDEKNYSAFISALGKSRCNTFDACLKGPANPYRSTDNPNTKFTSDCADLPYMLRGYFAWKNGLPFSVVVRVESTDGPGGDTRYSKNGNLVKARMDLVGLPDRGFPLGFQSLRTTVDNVHSGMYRFDPGLVVSGGASARNPDFYSTEISRDGIRPGTVIYDPNGHVAVVYSVQNDGRVLYMDAHPDNSLTRGTYGKKFVRSRPGNGAGFKNFRPLRLVGAERNRDGYFLGGRILYLPDAAIRGYDTTQFFGTKKGSSWKDGKFQVNGKDLDYYDWVRQRLAKGGLRYHPVEEMQNMLTAICNDLKDRVLAVNLAVEFSKNSNHPDRLPENIYGTEGDWEKYATSSRDARLRTSFVELMTQLKTMVNRQKSGDATIDYSGHNLRNDLLQAYREASTQCVIQYERSNGSSQKLNLEEVRQRLFALSFDPYHCPERRWGANRELATCGDNSVKRAWYEAEQNLRNQLERTYDIKMNFSLRDLQNKVPGSGAPQSPDIDIVRYLESI